MFHNESLQHLPTRFEIEPEFLIFPEHNIQEIPQEIPAPAIIPPPCDLLDDFDDFVSANPSANPSPFPQEAFNTTSSTLSKALRSPDADKWKVAILKEFESMLSNKVWIEVEDKGQPRMYSFIILKIKPNDDGTGPKHKARIVAGGDRQVPDRDYNPDDISFSVLKNTSLKLLICKAIELGLQIFHIDIVTAFLNSPVKFELYMELPSELAQFGTPKLVKLLKGLYGCHDAGKLWWDLLHNVLVNDMQFIQSTNDSCLYTHSNKTIFMGVYVDDLPLVASHIDYAWFCETLVKFFKLTNKGPMQRCLGI